MLTSRSRRCLVRRKLKVKGDYNTFLSRINKSLYYGKLPMTERFSLPVSEAAAEIFSEIKNGRSLDHLDIEEAALLSRNACVSPCSLVLALLYLERLKTRNVEYLSRVAPSELFLVSMMIASKFLHDDGEEDEVFNDEWAASAGFSVGEVNRFEKDFLEAMAWEVYVNEKDFWTKLRSLEKDIALREGKKRGWFSYSDLDHLLEMMDLAAVAQTVISVSAVCLTSYTAGVLTLLGSAFIVSHIPGNCISTSMSQGMNNISTSTHVLDSSIQPLSSSGNDSDFVLSSLCSCPGVDSDANMENKEYAQISNDIRNVLLDTFVDINWSLENSSNFYYGKFNESCDSSSFVQSGLSLEDIFREYKSLGFTFDTSLFHRVLRWLSVISTWSDYSVFREDKQMYLPFEVSVCC